MYHWATPLIGKPWEPGAEGPQTFDCWGLVRYVFRDQHGIEMPDVHHGQFSEVDKVAAIKRAADVSGWRRTQGDDPAADDIVMMTRVADGRRHVGVMIKTIRGLRLLHADGHMTVHGPVGAVVAVALKDAMAEGYGSIELWRRA